jgi:outer membrane receptor protein involved in Fe transport
MLPVPWRPGADFTLALFRLVVASIAVVSLASPWEIARADPPDGAALDPPVQEVTVRGRATSQTSAAQTVVGRAEIEMRPRLRAEEVLEIVPGLFTVQHSGGAKAQQYFLRGFDADHGTDIAFFVDGVPLNAVSHAHGQGYTDLHFLIPELILSIEATQGPYSVRAGDFATAGSVELRLADHLPESRAGLQVGPHGHARGLVIDSPDMGNRWRAVVAAEVFRDDGFFVHPENHHRLNTFARLTHVLDGESELSLTWMGYGASWNASGEIPARGVCGDGDGNPPPQSYPGGHCVSRFDSVDPTQGGGSQRTMASLAYSLRRPGVDLNATAYLIHSSLQLFLNETFFANDPMNGVGDGIEQDDTRTVLGANTRVTLRSRLAGIDLGTTLGIQIRDDLIDNGLQHQVHRLPLETLQASGINETELGAFVEEDFHPARWLRFVLGARADRVAIAVENRDPSAATKTAGVASSSLLSPKATAVVSPLRGLDFFANYGRGFHSNDGRGVVAGGTLLATTAGYDVGLRFLPTTGLSLSAAAFVEDLTSELVFDGDAATTSPAGRTRREGFEIAARYHLRQEVFADAAFTMTRARFRDDDGTGTYVPLAPWRTFAAGIGIRERIGEFVPFGSLRVKSIADRPATRDGTLTAQGFTLVDAQAGLRWKQIELALDILNVLDTSWREGQFAITSRLPYERAAVTAMSFTPGSPREVLGRVTLYW